ncbi:hypothetical protein SARC_13762, partial [Sphaeroforma arctica JP610]
MRIVSSLLFSFRTLGDSEFSTNCHEVHNVLKKIKAAGGGFDADEEAGIANVSAIEDTR